MMDGVAGESRIVAFLDRAVRWATHAVESSRTVDAVRNRARECRALPMAEWRICATLMIATALAGHVLMASLLPSLLRPTVALTAVALLGASLAAAAAIARNR
jgi:hypothetical protein